MIALAHAQAPDIFQQLDETSIRLGCGVIDVQLCLICLLKIRSEKRWLRKNVCPSLNTNFLISNVRKHTVCTSSTEQQRLQNKIIDSDACAVVPITLDCIVLKQMMNQIGATKSAYSLHIKTISMLSPSLLRVYSFFYGFRYYCVSRARANITK